MRGLCWIDSYIDIRLDNLIPIIGTWKFLQRKNTTFYKYFSKLNKYTNF